jgi:hypothetical protein
MNQLRQRIHHDVLLSGQPYANGAATRAVAGPLTLLRRGHFRYQATADRKLLYGMGKPMVLAGIGISESEINALSRYRY